MKLKSIFSVLLLFLLIFSGCNFSPNLSFVPEKQRELAKIYLSIIRSGRTTKLDSITTPYLKEMIDENIMFSVDSVLKQNEVPKKILMVGSNYVSSPDSSLTSITYEYEFAKSYALANVTMITKDSTTLLAGFRVWPMNESLAEINAFALTGKSFLHYSFLLFGALSLLFILYSLIICAKSKINKKWLWIIFILIGLGKFGIIWTNGQVFFSIFTFQILGFGITKSGIYAPWVVSISFPLGAILFLIKRKKLIEKHQLNLEAI